MDDFRAIYKILKILHGWMDCEEVDTSQLSPEKLGISNAKRDSLLIMLSDEGYIKNLDIDTFIGERRSTVYICEGCYPEITLRGLEYLHENSMMKKVSEVAKSVVGAIK